MNFNKVIVLLILILKYEISAQGIIVKSNAPSPNIDNIDHSIDPARYEKLMIIDLKIGSLYADDRGFQRLMKDEGFKAGSRNFANIGFDFKYIKRKINFGFTGNFAFQTSGNIQALKHNNWQFQIGKTLLRNKGKILLINANLGAETSNIKFGANPFSFLATINLPHDQCTLSQKQLILGPSISFDKILDTDGDGKGITFGIDAGVNFAPFAPIWKYGYKASDGQYSEFVGETITNMPYASRQSFFVNVKIGGWGAR